MFSNRVADAMPSTVMQRLVTGVVVHCACRPRSLHALMHAVCLCVPPP
jgi:hypothetical protein